ncbi:DeoR/GlpR family DNA-binding transcription regulator [Breznakiella homolactica]|uniref:DeoR/GlpR transcriptional regulator n=1 Tax=Breznakiella homolactica TaxID=2798577 RepID=A0A7T7XQE3_9SPIR|nr:DeoR/GlpR family DNA-binding transcription regulator [Breznakiella homolactica]QQO10590.1 DeoR/GlpR family DNA-binding transcription regulator [Breznakiella homolactica]
MIPYERRKRMLAELEKQELVNLEDFGSVLGNVSLSTIRRDLRTLEAEGQIVILRGGAAKMKSGSYDTPVSSRQILHVREKELVARTAADLIKDGEVVYIDAGSSALRMIKHLKSKRISIVTTNASIMSEVAETDFKCLLVGGELLKSTASLVGPLTDNILKDMYFDKAFIGATGYDLQAGINTPDEREANKKAIVKNNSKETYVLADSSKEGIQTLCKAFELNECIIITDRETALLKEHARYIIAR